MKRAAIAFLGLAAGLSPARADDLTGADKILCSTGRIAACCDDGQCGQGSPDELNMPQFIEIDVPAKRVSTTRASGLNRQTTVDNLKRAGGQLVLQGTQNGRAFTILIDEKTGEMTAAVAASECSVSAFGTCTPLSGAK